VMQRAVSAGTPIADYIRTQLADLTSVDLANPAPNIQPLYDWSASKGVQAAAAPLT
jgi:hypothetical protein